MSLEHLLLSRYPSHDAEEPFTGTAVYAVAVHGDGTNTESNDPAQSSNSDWCRYCQEEGEEGGAREHSTSNTRAPNLQYGRGGGVSWFVLGNHRFPTNSRNATVRGEHP